MFTLGYAFRPWTEAKAIADGPSILNYVRETARAYRVDEKIRFRHRVVRAEWSSADARWTVEVERGDGAETVTLTCNFLFMCSGYYRYDAGYTPGFEGTERFAGRIVHPQHWTDDIDYAGKRVVVIGSGATAVTLVPAMAESAAHVTMLQRSPSYVASLPAEDALANLARRLLPDKARVCPGALEERPDHHDLLPALPPPPAADEGHAPQGRRAPPSGRVRRGHPLQAPLQPVGSAGVPGARRRPLRGAEQRERVGGHRSHRDVHGEGPEAGVRRRARGGSHHHGDRPEHEAAGRHGDRGGRTQGRALREPQLQGLDAERGTEPRLLDRLHERVVDAQVRPDL